MKRKQLVGLGWLVGGSVSLCPLSCLVHTAPIGPCSDLEVGEQLRVTLREPLVETAACDPVLGFVEGAELTLLVEDLGPSSPCSSAIGPTVMGGVELEYWVEATESASGSGAFVSVSRNFGPCLGGVNLTIVEDENESDTTEDVFDQMRITYQAPDSADCPRRCDVPYRVEVERL